MSDTSQGPSWWQASDGKWYPPEQHPSAGPQLPPPTTQPTTVPQPPPITPSSPVIQAKKPWWRRWWAIALGGLIVVGGIAAVAGPNDEDDEPSDSGAQPVADIEGGEADPATPASDDSPEPTSPDADADADADPGETAEQPTVGSRSEPFAVGSAVSFTLDAFGDADGSVWTLTVDGSGSDMTQAVLGENQFNDPPEEGRLFYGVPVTLTLDGASKEPLSPLFNISLEFFGPSTLEIISDGFSEGCGVTPDELDPLKEVFVGGSISGVVCYSVTTADVDAGILLTLDEIEGGRIFLTTR